MSRLSAMPSHHAALPPLSRVAFAAAELVMRWELRKRLRLDLSRLDAHLLRDIGLTPHLAEAEARKPFWCA